MLPGKCFSVDLQPSSQKRSDVHCFLYLNSLQRGLNQKAYNKIKDLKVNETSG